MVGFNARYVWILIKPDKDVDVYESLAELKEGLPEQVRNRPLQKGENHWTYGANRNYIAKKKKIINRFSK